ncbi:MAG: hypothetical protein ABR922_10540 [Streptosporangiaceae bacterium]|jgi:hypothetical protein
MTTDKTAITVHAAVDRFLASPRCRQPTTRRSYVGMLDRVAGKSAPAGPLYTSQLARRVYDYADVSVMPTSARSPCSEAVNARKLSA